MNSASEEGYERCLGGAQQVIQSAKHLHRALPDFHCKSTPSSPISTLCDQIYIDDYQNATFWGQVIGSVHKLLATNNVHRNVITRLTYINVQESIGKLCS